MKKQAEKIKTIKVTQYETPDGKKFPSLREAECHVSECEEQLRINQLRENLSSLYYKDKDLEFYFDYDTDKFLNCFIELFDKQDFVYSLELETISSIVSTIKKHQYAIKEA